jgi:signal peptide peptidase SppA
MNASSPAATGPSGSSSSLLAATLGISLLINLAAVGVLADGSPAAAGDESWGEDEFPQFSETHSYGAGTTKVVRILFTGILTRELDGGWLGTVDPVEDCLRQIRAARQDDEVAAILLEVDSPGGEVTAADEIHRELTLFKESREDRKLVVLVHDMAASGGYYISVPADRILAQPTALIGSIGVIMQTLNIQGLSEKIGVTDTTIKSGKNKDLLNPFHPVDPAQVASCCRNPIDAMHDRFVEPGRRRPLPQEIRTEAAGRRTHLHRRGRAEAQAHRRHRLLGRSHGRNRRPARRGRPLRGDLPGREAPSSSSSWAWGAACPACSRSSPPPPPRAASTSGGHKSKRL